MKDYYKILNLQRGATGDEIKKQYFKLLRQHSPEKDPEGFKELREAYEYLQNENNRKQLWELTTKEPFAERMLNQIQQLIREKIYWDAANTAQEALRYFKNERIFLYYLAYCERLADYTGSAVKDCERLLKLEPEHPEARCEMAFCYQARGYANKAMAAFEAAYASGCRDLEFMSQFVRCCAERKKWKRAEQIAGEAIADAENWTKEQLYYGLKLFNSFSEELVQIDKNNDWIFQGFIEMTRKCRSIFERQPDDYKVVCCNVLNVSVKDVRVAAGQIRMLLKELDRENLSKGLKDSLKELSEELTEQLVQSGDQISETMKYVWEMFMGFERFCKEERPDLLYGASLTQMAQKMGMLDAKLCLAAEMPRILPEVDLMREISPEFYDKISDFVNELQDVSARDRLKSQMLREYRRMSARVGGGGRYFELHPEDAFEEKVIYQYDQPYIRKERKIGRNEPCPCGSGKKYKNCCGKN